MDMPILFTKNLCYLGCKHREFQRSGCEILNKGLQLSVAEFDRHLDKKKTKKDERNVQTLTQGFGGLLLGCDCLIKIEKISATSHNNKKYHQRQQRIKDSQIKNAGSPLC